VQQRFDDRGRRMTRASSPTIVLIGGTGRLGRELQGTLALVGDLTVLSRHDVDLERPEDATAVLHNLSPDVIVNAAAYTDVDAAESDAGRACRVNADAPGVLAGLAATQGAWFVHFSTDFVFDGTGTAPHDESATPRPLSVYGRSKLDGERRVAASGARWLILRTGWLYAEQGPSFPRKILAAASMRDRLQVVDDQVGAPTGADLVASLTAHAVRTALARPEVAGLYHVAAAGETSRHAYARHLIALAHDRGWPLRAGPDSVQAVSSNALPTPAVRPLNARLDTRRFRRTFGVELPDWREGVERLVDAWSTTRGR
jgi:dTDP-4-dehydrorhamnose reductase